MTDTETVKLTVQCARRGHVLLRVLDTEDGMVIDAPLYAAGPTRQDWTPAQFRLTPGDSHRYACRCQLTDFLPDTRLATTIAAGIERLFVGPP